MTARYAFVIWIIAGSVGMLFGYMFGSGSHIGKDATMRQFQSWTLSEQQDFILAAISDKAMLRREIAEDWCAINKKTQRVCWNAKLNHPMRGMK